LKILHQQSSHAFYAKAFVHHDFFHPGDVTTGVKGWVDRTEHITDEK